jgi:hypothetical protein
VSDLDVECLTVRRRRTDAHARHGAQAARRLGCWRCALASPPLAIW